jgi:hypothetical protein
MEDTLVSRSLAADDRHPDLDVRLHACVGWYERALDESLKAGGDPPDPLTEQVDMEAEWLADSVTEGTKDPSATEGWPWDYAYLANTASDLMRHIGQSGLYPPLEERLAPEEHMQPEQAKAPGQGAAGWPLINERRVAITTKSNAVLEVARKRISTRLAWDAVDRFRDSPVRMLLLANLIAKTRPGLKALHRVGLPSRCFVWGLDMECIILCRNVVDRAIANAAPADPHVEAAAERIRRLEARTAEGRLCGPDRALAAMRDTLAVLEATLSRSPSVAQPAIGALH